jgi:hypothetical protein
MAERGVLTLTDAARLIGEPQHLLIHLCEKGVIVPDISDAGGRGSSLRFSIRNLLEFAVALKMRESMIPVAAVAAVIHVLRAFERRAAKDLHGFTLPESLQRDGAPDLRIVLSDGRRLSFTLGVAGRRPRVFDGIDIRGLRFERGKFRGATVALAQRQGAGAPTGSEFGQPEGSKHIRVEVSVTRIARDLPRL